MRSTNIVIFLVLLNASAVMIGAALGPNFDQKPAVGGDSAINDARGADDELQSSKSGLDEFVGTITMAAGFLKDLRGVVFAGPEMFRALGAPDVIVTGFESVVVFIFAIDMAEIISGRALS